MKKGDKIIWDSHFGYEIGYFIGENDNVVYNTYKVELITGIVTGVTSRSKHEVIPFTDEALKQMIKKYKYTKTFTENE